MGARSNVRAVSNHTKPFPAKRCVLELLSPILVYVQLVLGVPQVLAVKRIGLILLRPRQRLTQFGSVMNVNSQLQLLMWPSCPRPDIATSASTMDSCLFRDFIGYMNLLELSPPQRRFSGKLMGGSVLVVKPD